MRTWQDILFRATRFERDRQAGVRALIVGAAILTYLVDRDDIIWRFIKNAGSQTRMWEHWLFLVATALIGIGAYLCTAALNAAASSAYGKPEAPDIGWQFYAGQFLYSVGLASLVPLSGALILILGEGVRVLRLGLVQEEVRTSGTARPEVALGRVPHSFAEAARMEALKWAIFVTMIVFTITLRDRYADVLIGLSILISALLNWPAVRSCFSGQAA